MAVVVVCGKKVYCMFPFFLFYNGAVLTCFQIRLETLLGCLSLSMFLTALSLLLLLDVESFWRSLSQPRPAVYRRRLAVISTESFSPSHVKSFWTLRLLDIDYNRL
jgi:hypothetical protein